MARGDFLTTITPTKIMSKDIGYYVDFLSPEKLEEIRNAKVSHLIHAIMVTGQTLYLETDTEVVRLNEGLYTILKSDLPSLTTSQLTALMRGLCDELDHRMRN
jgi:hypothetical protein